MPRVRLDQPVNSEYGLTTCSDLLNSGKAVVERVENFGRNMVTKYFCTLLNLDGTLSDACFEIGQKAYESRAAIGQNQVPVLIKPESPTLLPVAFDGTVLSVGNETFTPLWDEDSESFELDLHAQNDSTPAILKALQAVMTVCEWDTAMYGETLVINFLP